jgi:hypothetical protein
VCRVAPNEGSPCVRQQGQSHQILGSKDRYDIVGNWLSSSPSPTPPNVRQNRHQHKNTIQALAWSPNGNLVASASRDQTARVFDIRAMKEFRVLKGHKEVCCNSSPSYHGRAISERPNPSPSALAWHPIHPILVSGGSEGVILGPRRALAHLLATRCAASRDALPSPRLQRVVADVPPARSPPHERLQRPHHAVLVARAPGRRLVRLLGRRREAARGARRGGGGRTRMRTQWSCPSPLKRTCSVPAPRTGTEAVVPSWAGFVDLGGGPRRGGRGQHTS